MSDKKIGMLNNLFKKARDMLDGTHAEVIAEQTLIIQESIILDVGSASTQSSSVSATTNRIVICSTVDAWVAIGSNPTAAIAAAGSFFIAAGVPSYPLTVTPGITKVASIAASTIGKASIVGSA